MLFVTAKHGLDIYVVHFIYRIVINHIVRETHCNWYILDTPSHHHDHHQPRKRETIKISLYVILSCAFLTSFRYPFYHNGLHFDNWNI